jgi:hypothetical protein
MSEPRNILPTLIYKLARVSPLFEPSWRTSSQRPKPDAGVDAGYPLPRINTLPSPPPDQHTLVFVIDALDECGNAQSRPEILRVLRDATAEAPWLKIIVTSRAEVDIIHHFSEYSSKI